MPCAGFLGTASFNWLLCCYYLCLKLHSIGRLFATPISSHCTRSRVLLPLKHERLLWPFATPIASPWSAACNVDQGELCTRSRVLLWLSRERSLWLFATPIASPVDRNQHTGVPQSSLCGVLRIRGYACSFAL